MTEITDNRIIAGMEAQGRELAQRLREGAGRLGWKAGLGTDAAMAKVGTSAPVAGFLTGATAFADDATVDAAGWGTPTFEPELAVRLGRDVGPAASADEAGAAIAAIAPAIELVDLGALDDLDAVLAGNVFHRAVALGPWLEVSDVAAVAAARLDVEVDGEPVAADVEPALALGALERVVRALAEQVALGGERVRAGDVIITGSAIPAISLASGAQVAVALRGGGRVRLRVTR